MGSSAYSAFREKVEADIASVGLSVICTSTHVAEGLLSMAYTIGLTDVGHPEILVFGLPHQSALIMLNDAADRLRAGQLPLDTPITKLSNLPVVFKEVAPSRAADYVIQANARAGKELPVIQMVWPDPAGKLPWQDGFDKTYAAVQPTLYLSE